MQSYVHRNKEPAIEKYLQSFPCVILLGARQVGKSTLAKNLLKDKDSSIYLDLEDPRDFAKLQDPISYLEANNESLICIDEIQRSPEIFTHHFSSHHSPILIKPAS